MFAAATANPLKVERMRSTGATVHLEGLDIEHPRDLVRSHADATGDYLVEDSLDLGSCEGAPTIGLKLVRTASRLDTILVSLGGGAFASGVGYVTHELSPRIGVVAVRPIDASAMSSSWRAGTVVTTQSVDTIADGVAGRHSIPEVFDDLLEVVDDVALVGEDSIKTGDATTLRACKSRGRSISARHRGNPRRP